ncbi:hypothetical protein QAD02_005482 [Eretmocerus hayati]|uniref:Uncharacterized protein n=1 Tax=Eretmocerus hayati TaxID=131215 RepID=A0ACC2NXF7_9HYME|nr:hypothetical protein QAD02_005482 [Eretmocerus hayati]
MLWPDPTDQSKLKPQTLKGTPANKFCALLFVGYVTVLTAGFHLIWYIPHFDRKLQKIREDTIRCHEEREGRDMLMFPMIQDAMDRKRHETEQEPEWAKNLGIK